MYLENQEALEFGRHTETFEEIELYDYIRRLAKKPAAEAQKDFYRFLFNANTYPEQSVLEALKRITAASDFARTGKYVINRCFYTIGNPWLQDRTRYDALKELTMCADKRPKEPALERHTRTWLKQVDSYFDSDLYGALKRQMLLLEEDSDSSHQRKDEEFGSALNRYPFVHEVVTITEDIPRKLRDSICHARINKIILLNQQLRQYAENSESSDREVSFNPTWIPDTDLRKAIWNYRPDRENSLFLQAKDFLQVLRTFRNLGQMRRELFSYIQEILVTADSRYKAGGFVYRLEQALQQGGADDMPINLVSVTIICQRILQFLIVKDIYRSTPVELMNMIKRVGHQVVTTVLLRIVLFWKRICPWMESRFGILLHLYESHNKSDIDWVVQTFEHMNVALALNHQQVGYLGSMPYQEDHSGNR